MAIEKIVNIVVKEDGIDKAIQGADRLGDELRSVEHASNGLSKGMDKSTSSLLDNGGAMGLLNDATGGMAMTVKDAVESMDLFSKGSKVATAATALQTWVTNGANVATKAFRATLIATGIGAVVVLITALVVAMSNMESATEKAEHAQKLLNDQIEKSSRLLSEELSAIDFVTKARILRAETAGAGEKELGRIEKEASESRLAALKEEQRMLLALQGNKNLTPEKAKEVNERLLKNTAAFNKELQDQELGRLGNEKDNADKSRALLKDSQEKKQALIDKANEKIKEDAKAELAAYKALLQAKRDADLANEAEITAAIDEARELNINRGLSEQESELRAVNDKYFKLIEMAKEQHQSTMELEDAQANERNDINLKYQKIDYDNKKSATDAKIALDKAELEARMQNMSKVGNLLGNLSEMLGKSTVAGKAAAVAQATISTYQSAVQSYNSLSGIPIVGPALGAVAAGVAIKSGIDNVRKILAVKTPGGGGSGSAPSATAITPPQFNIVGQSGTNQLAQSIGSQQRQPVEAYVVSGNMTSAQAMDRHRQQTATFGG